MHLRNAFFLLISLTISAVHAEVQVNTRFQPPRIAAGNPSKYIIEIVDTSSDSMPGAEPVTSLPLPQINGLTLRNGQTSSGQQTLITNGVREYKRTQQLIIDAVAPKPGNYTIPGFNFEYKGVTLTAPTATLQVLERSANAAPTVDELIFLQTDAPEQLYVGQTTPINLKLYVSDSVRLRGLNAFERNADGFTVSPLPEDSGEAVEIVNGRRYRVHSWPLTITPISSGPQSLNFQFTLSAQMPDQRNTRNSPFGNSLFDDFFGRTEQFNIYTAPTEIDVRALPKEGQPKSFSGAIGNFNMEVFADSDSTRVGEPIMLSLKLSGQGNYDRIKGPEMPNNKAWRNYAPEDAFDADPNQALKGVKRFDYVFIPEQAGALKLPGVQFSFFDPKTKKYVELTSPPLPVQVAPSDRPSVAAPVQEAKQSETDSQLELSNALSPDELLITLDYRPTKGRAIDPQPLKQPWFYGINIAALLLITTASIWSYRNQRYKQSAHYALTQQAKQELEAALTASRSDDDETFYRSAQDAIRLASTVRTQRNLRAADSSELTAIFHELKLSDTVIAQAQALLQAADNQRFSGQSSSSNIQNARTQLNTILKAL